MGQKLTNKVATKRVEIEDRRTRVAEVYLRGGNTHTETGVMFGVSRATIARDITKIKEEWREAREHDVDLAITIELKRLEIIEAQAWDQWERSKLAAEKTKSSRTNKDGVDTQHKQVETINQCGDPRYLNVVLTCIEKRSALLGLNKPVKVDVEMTPQQRQERLNRLAERYGLN